MPHTPTHRKFRARLERLPLQELKNDLQQTLGSSFIADRLPGGRADIDRVLNLIEDTGQVPGDIVELWQNWPNPEERKDLLRSLSNLQNIASKLPSARGVVESLKTPEAIAGEAGLTEAQLEERAAALGTLPTTPGFEKPINQLRAELKSTVLSALNEAPEHVKNDPNKNSIADQISDSLLRAENRSSESIRKKIEEFYAESEGHEYIGDIVSNIKDKLPSIKPTIETEADVSRLQDILGARRARTAAEQQIESFVTSLPEELAGARRPLIEAERQAGAQFLEQELFPDIKEQLAVRGLQFGGDLPFELARATGGVQRGLEQFETGLATEDDIFFQNAGYQSTLTKALEAGQDVGFQIGVQRQQARAGQEQRFGTRLAELAGQKELELFRRQQERALTAGTERLRRQQEAQRRQSQAGLFESIFTPIAQIGTSFALGKALGPAGGGVTTG